MDKNDEGILKRSTKVLWVWW